MSRHGISTLRFLRFALALCISAGAWAGTFGKVVSVGGQASDLALDEARGVLYVANFTANRIEVMSLADLSIQRSINVAAQPSSLALSPDGKYLVIAHYGNVQSPGSPNNALTVIDLASNSRQTFGMGSPPLGVAFGIDSLAFIATTTEFVLFDPASGFMKAIDTVSGLSAKTLPIEAGTVVSQIVATSMAVSADGVVIYGLTDKFKFRYDSNRKFLSATQYTSSPALGPRAVSVNRDGTRWMGGWALHDPDGYIISQLPNATGALNIGSVQFDSNRDVIYCQMEDPNSKTPVLQILDAYNLMVRERLVLPENLSGKSVLSSDGSTMYSASESGVAVLPVGQLDRQPRVFASKQDLTFRGNYCDRNIASQEVTITSNGASADFKLTSDNPAVRISPSTGVTPATVRISVDPSAFEASKGTSSVTVKIESAKGMNQIDPIRILVNAKEPDQRGNVISLGGKLVDLVADPDQDRFFVLRQDRNEVLVFDGSTFTQTATLKTYNTPKSMAITFDRRFLLVGHDNSHYVAMFDLETLEPLPPIRLATGDYAQAIAASGKSILAMTRDGAGGDNQIHRIDLTSRSSTPLVSLGVFKNQLALGTVMTPSANGRYILIAQPDGTLMLYDASVDSFTVSRKEATALVGAYAASNFDQFAVGNALLNSSLVPTKRFDDSTKSSGFVFLDNQTAIRIGAPSQSAPGILQRVDLASGSVRPTRTSEAPMLGTAAPDVFTRTLAPLASRNAIVALTTSGVTVFPWNFDAGAAPPRLDRIVNAADGTQPVAPGGLISVYGADLSPVSQSSRSVPLPTILGDTCLTVNGQPVPVMFVSPAQINAQLPFAIDGNTQLLLRTPGGVSDALNVTILPAAPSVFRNSTAGPETGIATVVRGTNGLVVTPSNPVHRGDVLTIYATGLGRTSPTVETGAPAPSEPLATALISPQITVGGVPVDVQFAGLAPGQVGVYQINVRVNDRVPLGLSVPLSISQGTGSTSLPVRVVE
jgi:uncharacterized protein (TIGR03437 family)